MLYWENKDYGRLLDERGEMMARTYKSEGRRLAHLVRAAFAAIAVLLFMYAFPTWDREYMAIVLAIGWIAGELAGAWWIRRRRAYAKRTQSRNRTV